MSKSIVYPFLIVAIFAAGTYFSHEPLIKVTRKPASSARPKGFAKAGRSLQVDIDSKEFSDSSHSSLVKLVGHVTVFNAEDSVLHAQWLLPEGAQIEQGSEKQIQNDVKSGQVVDFEILVSGLKDTDAAKQITLNSFFMVGELPVGSSAVYSTQPHQVLLKTVDESGNEVTLNMTKGEIPLPDAAKR